MTSFARVAAEDRTRLALRMRPMSRITRRTILASAVLAVTLATGALATGALATDVQGADTVPPSHECVPEDTVLLVRIPQAKKFVEALRSQTKLGSVILSDKRYAAVVDFIREQAADALTEASTELAKYDLKVEDFPTLFEQEIGFALIVEARKDAEQSPLTMGLWWLEPSTDLGERLVKAIGQLVDDQKDETNPIRRVDLDLEGRQVMHLTIPITSSAPYPEGAFEGLDKLEPEQVRAKLEELRKEAAEKQIVTDQMHVFVTRIGDRLLIGNTFPTAEALSEEEEEEDKDRDFDAITGVEEAKGVFARFLKSHAEGSSGVTSRLLATPGLSAALPDGIPLFELLASPEPLMKLATDPTTIKMLKTFGFDKIGAAALRVTLDDGALRTGAFLSIPEPRHGLLALLDQSQGIAEPPAWAPAKVLGFAQVHFDLGKAYTVLRDLIVGEGGDTAQQAIQQLEEQIRTVTQTDVPALLSSVGEDHYIVMFEPTKTKVTSPDGESIEVPAQRQGIVWQVKDEAPWKRLIQLGAGFAALSEGMVTASQEQGFMGLRLNVKDVIQGGVFVGHGYLVLGIGPEVTETLLSTLRNPPEGADALRGGDLMKRAAKLLPPEACLYYQVSDFNRYAKTIADAFMSALELPTGLAINDSEEGSAATKTLTKFKELLPSEEELEGSLGVMVGHLIVNQHGLVYRMALELPAP